jgi:hypothetical protein
VQDDPGRFVERDMTRLAGDEVEMDEFAGRQQIPGDEDRVAVRGEQRLPVLRARAIHRAHPAIAAAVGVQGEHLLRGETFGASRIEQHEHLSGGMHRDIGGQRVVTGHLFRQHERLAGAAASPGGDLSR